MLLQARGVAGETTVDDLEHPWLAQVGLTAPGDAPEEHKAARRGSLNFPKPTHRAPLKPIE